ncbi:MAG: CvpA family protein [Chitinophagia bacterium]|nr:CvpA family protein [Chitinophagia bacterium]
MILDVATVAILAYAFVQGMSRGFIVSAFSFASLFVGLVAAVSLSAAVAQWLTGIGGIPVRWLPLLAFLMVFGLARWLVGVAGRMAKASAEAMMLGGVDKAGGVILHVILYGTLYSIILFYLRELGLLGDETVSTSRTYPWVSPWGPWVMGALSHALPFLGDMMRSLKEYFREASGPLTAPRA